MEATSKELPAIFRIPIIQDLLIPSQALLSILFFLPTESPPPPYLAPINPTCPVRTPPVLIPPERCLIAPFTPPESQEQASCHVSHTPEGNFF